jgi:hypothetical protein
MINTMRIRSLCVLLLFVSLGAGLSRAQTHTERGAVLGGVTGALAGAAIGDHNDETAAGALIGGAVGLITGATIGKSADQREARAQAYQQHRLRQLSRAVSPVDVVTMSRNGLSDLVIINHIRENGVRQNLEVGDVISLHQQGVSEAVITAMQQGRLAGSARVPHYPPASAPVVVEQHYVSPAPYYWPPRVHYWHHPPHAYPRYRSGVQWNVTIGR